MSENGSESEAIVEFLVYVGWLSTEDAEKRTAAAAHLRIDGTEVV